MHNNTDFPTLQLLTNNVDSNNNATSSPWPNHDNQGLLYIYSDLEEYAVSLPKQHQQLMTNGNADELGWWLESNHDANDLSNFLSNYFNRENTLPNQM